MCIRDRGWYDQLVANIKAGDVRTFNEEKWEPSTWPKSCLLYTSDAADERSSVDLGGRRIIKKTK